MQHQDTGTRDEISSSPKTLFREVKGMIDVFPDLPYPYNIQKIFAVPFELESKAASWAPPVGMEKDVEPFVQAFGANPLEVAVTLGKAEGLTSGLRTAFAYPDISQKTSIPVLKNAHELSIALARLSDAAVPHVAALPEAIQAQFKSEREIAAKSVTDLLSLNDENTKVTKARIEALKKNFGRSELPPR